MLKGQMNAIPWIVAAFVIISVAAASLFVSAFYVTQIDVATDRAYLAYQSQAASMQALDKGDKKSVFNFDTRQAWVSTEEGCNTPIQGFHEDQIFYLRDTDSGIRGCITFYQGLRDQYVYLPKGKEPDKQNFQAFEVNW